MELHTIEASINGRELTIKLFSVFFFFNYYGFFSNHFVCIIICAPEELPPLLRDGRTAEEEALPVERL